MAAEKLPARPATIRQESEEASDSSSQSDQNSAPTYESFDSDSLDSHGSRKRRKVSPAPQNDDDEPAVPIVSQPTRIKSRIKSKESNIEKITIQAINSAVLAPVDPQTSFAALGVKPWLVASLGAMAIKRPTGIQKGCIPEIISGRDCIGGSRTGSGKTVAFAVPILQQWAEDPFGIFALVLTPTRYGIFLWD
jgi:ATP-dependent RNA helicase DDX49/DBP8